MLVVTCCFGSWWQELIFELMQGLSALEYYSQ